MNKKILKLKHYKNNFLTIDDYFEIAISDYLFGSLDRLKRYHKHLFKEMTFKEKKSIELGEVVIEKYQRIGFFIQNYKEMKEKLEKQGEKQLIEMTKQELKELGIDDNIISNIKKFLRANKENL